MTNKINADDALSFRASRKVKVLRENISLLWPFTIDRNRDFHVCSGSSEFSVDDVSELKYDDPARIERATKTPRVRLKVRVLKRVG